MSKLTKPLVALSVRQPYASLILCGAKKFEVRSWPTAVRGRIALHASAALAHGWQEWSDHWYLQEVALQYDLGAIPALPRGAIIGTVEIADVWPPATAPDRFTLHDAVMACDPYYSDEYLFELQAPRRSRVVPCHGKLNLWTVPDALVAKMRGR